MVKGEIWCPQYKELRLLPCVRPPPKAQLIEKLTYYLGRSGKAHGIREGHLPDKRWVISVLSTVAPKDEIFGKSYVPPSHQKQQELAKVVDLPPSFVNGLPVSKGKHHAGKLRLTQEARSASKLQKLQEAKSRLEEKLAQE